MSSIDTSYQPRDIFGAGTNPPRAYISPGRYVQGPGVIDRLGEYLGLLDVTRVGILASARRRAANGQIDDVPIDSAPLT